MKLDILKGTTSKIVEVFIQDSSSTIGAGLTGVAFGDITVYYALNGASGGATVHTPATMTIGTWASGGFIQKDATNMPGVYQLGVFDAALTGADSVLIMLKGATNMAPVVLEIQLVDYDPYDVIRMGLTALPAFAAGAAGGLPDDTDANGAVRIVDGTGAREINTNAGAIALVDLVTDLTNLPSIPANWLTAAGINAGAFTAAKFAANWLEAGGINAGAFTAAKFAANWLEAGGIVAAALDGKGDWNINKTGYDLNADQSGVTIGTLNALAANVITATSINAGAFTAAKFAASWLEAGGIVAAAFNGKGDWNIGKTGYTAGPTAASFTTAAWAAGAINAAALSTDAIAKISNSMFPKINTALSDIEFLMVDDTDHVTPKTGISPIGVTRSIDGGAFGAGTGTAAEVGNGIYQYDASMADMNGALITFRFTGTDADDTFLSIRTAP